MASTVLLVEDDPDIQLITRLALRKSGFNVNVASNGRQALEAVRAALPDLVLLDWMMPELDGLETCRHLKADPATSGIPVIFLTAKSQEQEIARGLALGATGYITKPFDALSLGKQIRDLLPDLA
jgi:two-component system, OmpR family, alkaline phosphatase synthesis response regulator PhoP